MTKISMITSVVKYDIKRENDTRAKQIPQTDEVQQLPPCMFYP